MVSFKILIVLIIFNGSIIKADEELSSSHDEQVIADQYSSLKNDIITDRNGRSKSYFPKKFLIIMFQLFILKHFFLTLVFFVQLCSI